MQLKTVNKPCENCSPEDEVGCCLENPTTGEVLCEGCLRSIGINPIDGEPMRNPTPFQRPRPIPAPGWMAQ